MDHPRHEERIVALVRQAMELAPAARAAFLDEVSASEPGDVRDAVRDEVERILAKNGPTEADDGRYPTTDLGPSDTPGETGRRIGPYEITKWLGQGGFAEVYQAVRRSDFTRKVAIKLIRQDRESSRTILSRFEIERQILAEIEHENIARLLDGGKTDDGRPFFVMEYVDGKPVTDFCDQQKLTIADRLRVFEKICRAVAHAHRFGVIHRDIKPGNIMMTKEGTPKLVDFGIAKLTDMRSTRRDPTLTETGMVPMTPQYASPEQAAGDSVTTASDVYSLGVVLYELLTGSRPYVVSEIHPAKVVQNILSSVARKPSSVVVPTADQQTRDSSLDATHLKTIASNRSTPVNRLSRSLRGDLDVITLKALHKEPDRRYRTAQEFADDIAAYLAGQPILARRDSLLYSTRKFVQRHRAFAASAFLVLTLLVVSLVAISVAWRRADDMATTLRASLYEAEMASAYEAWESAHLDRVETLLAEHLPQDDEEDLRGFEWFYLAELCRDNAGEFETFDKQLGDVALDKQQELLYAAVGTQVVKVDLATGQQTKILEGADVVNCLDVSDDGQQLAVGYWKTGASANVEVYKLGGERQYEVIFDTPSEGVEFSRIEGIEFSTTGTWVAGCDSTGRVQVWDAATGEQKWEGNFDDGVARVRLAFSPDEQTLAGVFQNGHLMIWDVATGKERKPAQKLGPWLRAVAFSPDGSRLAVVGRTLYVIDMTTLEMDTSIWQRDLGYAHCVAFSPDGKYLVTGNHKNAIQIWDLEANELVARQVHSNIVDFVSYSLDGKTLYSASDRVFRTSRLEKQELSTAMGQTWGTTYSIDEKRDRIALPGPEPANDVLLWDLSRSQPDQLAGHQDEVLCTAFSNDSRLLASGDWSGSVRVWNTATKAQLYQYEFHPDKNKGGRYVLALAASPIQDLLVMGGPEMISAVQMSTGSEVWSQPGRTAESVVFARDGRMFSAGGDGWYSGPGNITVWDVADAPRELQRVPHDLFVSHLALWHSPIDNRILLAAADMTCRVTIYDATTTPIKPIGILLEGHTINLTTMTFSPDGRTLITGSYDGTMRLWSIATGRQVGIVHDDDDFYEVACLPSDLRRARFLLQIGFAELRIQEINLVDPDLSWMRTNR